MTALHGSGTELLADGRDISGWFRALDFTAEVETADATTFKNRWKKFVPGSVSASFELSGLYDVDLAAIVDQLASVTPGTILSIAPGGGPLSRLVKVLTTSYKESMPVGDLVAFSWGITADGPVGFGVLLLRTGPLTAPYESPTDVGPLGGTATGALVHYHVTDITPGVTWSVALRDSANGTDFDTLATSADDTGAGSGRIIVTGPVRRYTKAVFTFSEPPATVSASVSLART